MGFQIHGDASYQDEHDRLWRKYEGLHRDAIVDHLERHSIQCYDDESVYVLLTALIENILDGTIPECEVNYG